MRRPLTITLLAGAVLILFSVGVFRYALEISWVDAFYFTVTTVTTVGYGDITLHDAPWWLKLYGAGLMIAGTLVVAAGFGLVTDALVRANLEEYFTPWRRRMKDHIVVCGLGNLGMRVVEHLHRTGAQIVVVEIDGQSRFLDDARRLKAAVIIGDMQRDHTLQQAGIENAKALILASDNDLANLDAGLHARDKNPGIRVVMRMFDQSLASKIRDGFAINTAMSTSGLAAPAFAMAALDPAVTGSYAIGDVMMLIVEMKVAAGSPLDQSNTAEVYANENLSILCHESAATGEQSWHPAQPIDLAAGDTITVTAAYEVYDRIKELNRG